MTPPAPYAAHVAQLAEDYPLLGIALCHHTTQRGPLSFRNRPFQVEWYKDFPRLDACVARKAVQVGFSEVLIALLFERTGWFGRTCAYVMPTTQLSRDFVQRRVDPLFLTVPAYRDRLPGGAHGDEDGAGNLRIKRCGKGVMIFLGSNAEAAFTEFSTDVVIVDEWDHCDQRNLAMLPDRLRESPYPQYFKVGNPTLPRTGISAEYDESDGRQWFIRCEHCNERQAVDWFLHVVAQDDTGRWRPRDRDRENDPAAGDLRPVCQRCCRPFERRAAGACWVAERPGRTVRGYAMSRLDVLSDPLRERFAEFIKAQGSTAKIETFHRNVLGKAYETGGGRVTVELVTRNATGPRLDPNGGAPFDGKLVTAGIDVGTLFNVTVTERTEKARVLRWAGTVRQAEDLDAIMKRYRVRVACIDVGPERRTAAAFRDRMRATEGGPTVWLCEFHKTERTGKDDYGMKLDRKARIVQVDRTQLLDATMDDIREGRRIFPADILSVAGFADQMGAPMRKLDDTGSRYIWTKGVDHYRLADAYDRVAQDLSQRGGAYYVIESGDE